MFINDQNYHCQTQDKQMIINWSKKGKRRLQIPAKRVYSKSLHLQLVVPFAFATTLTLVARNELGAGETDTSGARARFATSPGQTDWSH